MELAESVIERLVDEIPELALLEDDFLSLSDATMAAIVRALNKKPHLRRGAPLLRALEAEFTLAQASEFKEWHGELPREKHDLLWVMNEDEE
jgi:hypothetical protein